MKVINILTKGFDSPNGRAFLFPLVKYRTYLRHGGICLNFFTAIKKPLYDCDFLFVESKFFSKQWHLNTESILQQFMTFKENINKVYYFDINDSSGWPHARVLPYIDAYFKNQLLKDKSLYKKSFYAHRIYADYYNKTYNIRDDNELYSEPIDDPEQLKKLKIGWNSGLANYSLYGPLYSSLHQKISLPLFLPFPSQYITPSINRPNVLSCRMGISYQRNSVAWQRRQIKKILNDNIPTNKLSRRRYFQELGSSKIVISPFGLGEITLKDFEVFLTGALLVKPDMSHMETWPDFYRDEETIISHSWDLTDLKSLIEKISSHYKDYVDIAHEGQKRYHYYLNGPYAADLFFKHLTTILQQ